MLHDEGTEVWSAAQIAIANSLIEQGFVEFSLHSSGKVIAKQEISVVNGMLKVIVSWLERECSLDIIMSDSRRHVHNDYAVEFHTFTKEEIAGFVNDIVGKYMIGLIKGEW